MQTDILGGGIDGIVDAADFLEIRAGGKDNPASDFPNTVVLIPQPLGYLAIAFQASGAGLGMDPVEIGADILPAFGQQDIVLRIEDPGTDSGRPGMGSEKLSKLLQIDELIKTIFAHGSSPVGMVATAGCPSPVDHGRLPHCTLRKHTTARWSACPHKEALVNGYDF